MPWTKLDRRTMLRAAGIAIGLPLLDSMDTGAQHAAAAEQAAGQAAGEAAGRAAERSVGESADRGAPPRVVLVGQPLGMYAPHFFPATTGRDYQSSRYLKLFEPLRGHFTVFSGMSHRYAAGHFAEVALFTGVSPEFIRERDIKNGVSLDQEVAQRVGHRTRFPSLILGGGNAAWNARGVRLPAESRATQVFKRLFLAGSPEDEARELRRVRNGQSILDDVGGQIQSLSRKVGTADRQRLESFLASVREAEQALKQDEQWQTTPKPKVDYPPPTNDFGGAQLIERSRQWYNLTRLALQTDSTRAISLWLGTQERPEIMGVSLGHHDASHHGQDPAKLDQLAMIEEAEMKVFSEFLESLRGIEERDGTLLDRTAVLYASNLGNSSSHDNNNLPILLAGGRFQHRGHVAFDAKDNKRMANLFVRMLRHMEIDAEKFGGSDGVVTEI